MRRLVLSLLLLSAAFFLVQSFRAPEDSTLPRLSRAIPVCDYRCFIRQCLTEARPYRPEKIAPHDACYPAIAYCLTRPFPLTPAGERAYMGCLFAALALGLAVLLGQRCRSLLPILLPLLCLTSAVASGPLRGNPSAWAGAAVFVFVAWYDSEVRWRRLVAAVALAFAVSLKVWPAVFGLLYLRGRLFAVSRWPDREIILAFAASAVFLVVPFAFFGGLGEIGVWMHNALANSAWYGRAAVYGFMGVFDMLVAWGVLPLDAWPVAHTLTNVGAVVFLVFACLARTRYLSVLLVGTALAFVGHHEYGLVYLVPAFVLWLADEAGGPAGRACRTLHAVLWFLILTPLWYSFDVSFLTQGVRVQNAALIVLAFSAVAGVIGELHPRTVRARTVKAFGLSAGFALLAAGAVFLWAVMSIFLPCFGEVSIWQVLACVGAPLSLLPAKMRCVAWACVVIGVLAFLLTALLHYGLTLRFARRFGRKGVVCLHLAFLVFLAEGWYLTFELADECFNIRREIRCLRQKSTLYADEFRQVDPATVSFPGEKRSLIVLVGESVEESFLDGSAFGTNLMPRLAKWRDRQVVMGTEWPAFGCDYSICALFGMVYGTPRLPVDTRDRHMSFCDYPDTCLSSAWRAWLDNGFACRFVKGGTVHFACTDKVFAAVPEVVIHDQAHFETDPDYLSEPDKNVFGVNDEVVIEKHLRQETLELAGGDRPFVLIVWTLNTHGPESWCSARKPRHHKDILADAVSQTDDIVVDYLEWVEKQPFFDRTDVVFVGDHIFHGAFAGAPEGTRRVVNAVASRRKLSFGERREFAAFDLAPTFLELSGARLEGGRFGLGTSLLSGVPTLLERIGRARYEEEIRSCGADYRRIALGW